MNIRQLRSRHKDGKQELTGTAKEPVFKQQAYMNLLSTIFEKAAFHVITDDTEPCTLELDLYYLKNPDGSMRWIWPAHTKGPLCLKFYNVQGKRARLFAILIRIVFLFGMAKWIFPKTRIRLASDEPLPFDITKEWALFTGTVGPNRKAIFYTRSDSGYHFIKVAIGKDAFQLLANEALTLNRLAFARFELLSFSFPCQVKTSGNSLKLSDVSDGERCSQLTADHLISLKELHKISGTTKALANLLVWKETKANLALLMKGDDQRIPQGMLRKLAELIKNTDETMVVETSLSHGDFTPWNMYHKPGRLSIYDWELSRPLMPLGFDAFHFIIQQGVLVEHKSWKAIEQEISTRLNADTFTDLSSCKTANVNLYLRLYLIINTIYYLNLYSNQQTWHTQVQWLLRTWNEALSRMMTPYKSNRELVLMDLFDFLLDKAYAALKFPHGFPENLSISSDVDLCVDPAYKQTIATYLTQHPLVKHSVVVRKSFMATQQLFFEDGSLLSIDLISTLKRKELVMMDVRELLAHSYLNVKGVKVPEMIDNARFIALFYSLNRAEVPHTYVPYRILLQEAEYPFDELLYQSFTNNGLRENILQNIQQQSANKGWHRIVNLVQYAADTLRSFVQGKGMVITFSGVDGAGKSTVIEQVKQQVDKKLRKKVIVLRHRPSLLPILGAWTKGKKAAEQEAATRLPRQGTNTGFVSSLLRFLYYYCDYFFGQFYVYFKYVMRGYVVLYDRYYFDFMSDGRRSNITLPSFITRMGYKLLLKPDMNFFLYAQPHLILLRKQELDTETIQQLTHNYRSLFEGLGTGKAKSRYMSIENVDLDKTLSTIINSMTFKVA